MPKITPFPYVSLRPQPDGTRRPRFTPGPGQRALGFEPRDLRHDDGTWFTLDQVDAFSKTKVKEIEAAIASGARVKKAKPAGRSLEDLLDDWIAACRRKVAVGDMSAATLDGYKKCRDAIVYERETRGARAERTSRERAAATLRQAVPDRPRTAIAREHPAAIGAPELRAYFDRMREQRGHHMALAMISAVSAAFTWGRESTRWRLGVNPRLEMEFERPEGRVMLIPLEQFSHLVAAADAIGRPSIGDSLYLGLFGGRRQTDRLLLKDEGLVDGRRQLRQSKTGKLIPIKDAPQLTRRLEAARARVAAIKLAKGSRPDTIVVDEGTGNPYNESTYRHWFAEVRRAASATMPACADKHDQDLRDTCVILLDRAGVSILGICDITGHSYSSVELIRKHYLGRNNAARADDAIDKLAAFVASTGVAV